MADGLFPSIISKTRDANSASNAIFTQLADNGGNAVTVTGNKLDVNATVTLDTAYVDNSAWTIDTDDVNAQGYLVDDTATSAVTEGNIGLARMTTDRKILTSSVITGTVDVSGSTVDCNGSNVTVDNASGAAAVNIQDGGNSITVDGTVAVSAVSGTVTVDGTVNVGTVSGTVTVSATQLDIDDLDAASDNVAISDGTDTLGVNSDGSINVNIVKSTITGEVHDYDTATPAADATSNHDYTVANTTMLLSSVIVSGSGNVKFEVQAGPLASLSTVAVGFLTGREGDTKQIVFDPPLEVPVTSTGTVRVIRTNRQNQAVDVYSTIIGTDV